MARLKDGLQVRRLGVALGVLWGRTARRWYWRRGRGWWTLHAALGWLTVRAVYPHRLPLPLASLRPADPVAELYVWRGWDHGAGDDATHVVEVRPCPAKCGGNPDCMHCSGSQVVHSWPPRPLAPGEAVKG